VHSAYVSHISHISSFCLALSVMDKEKDEKNILNMAGSGFESTVRLAKSNKEMWTPIFTENKNNILAVLNDYIEKLQGFKDAIAKNDKEELNSLIHKANGIKKILDK
ncbi:MAG: prephenate dehydrogenase dimerization domain-containing protein, partial [Bacteroidota bacterium]|nr:prephenate dehydrogenase dimerization domain-containing protein [Bacteroidota bacterium]